MFRKSLQQHGYAGLEGPSGCLHFLSASRACGGEHLTQRKCSSEFVKYDLLGVARISSHQLKKHSVIRAVTEPRHDLEPRIADDALRVEDDPVHVEDEGLDGSYRIGHQATPMRTDTALA